MNNDEKMRKMLEQTMPEVLAIKDLIDEHEIDILDLMRAVFLVGNAKKVSGWGSVTIVVKEGEVVSVEGKNTFISRKELVDNLNRYMRKKNMV